MALLCALAVGCATCWAFAPCLLTLRALALSAICASAQAKTTNHRTLMRTRVDILRATTPWNAARVDAIDVALNRARRLH
eukprot:5194792-Pleurochrysis_carterae.AAC.1